MSALERASQKKKKDIERTRRLSTVNMVLTGNGGDSPNTREENGDKMLSGAMNNLTVHQAAERGERERERLSHLSQPSNASTTSETVSRLTSLPETGLYVFPIRAKRSLIYS